MNSIYLDQRRYILRTLPRIFNYQKWKKNQQNLLQQAPKTSLDKTIKNLGPTFCKDTSKNLEINISNRVRLISLRVSNKLFVLFKNYLKN